MAIFSVFLYILEALFYNSTSYGFIIRAYTAQHIISPLTIKRVFVISIYPRYGLPVTYYLNPNRQACNPSITHIDGLSSLVCA